MTPAETVPDSERRGLIGALPGPLRPYASLMRLDRPIGAWLLFWPCAWGLALAGGLPERWDLLLWFALGAVAMRSAGCVWNDWVDRDLDRLVARTRSRPMASGRVGVVDGFVLLGALLLIGLFVLLQLRPEARIVALGSLVPVAIYPFAKRVTWWPQAWLGLVFSWGALVGWSAIAEPGWAPLFLYLGTIGWVFGYDTIYALQDLADDALVDLGSSARALGARVRVGVAFCYLLALAGWAAAVWAVRPQTLALFALLPVAVHLTWQVATLQPAQGEDALAKFRSNRLAGLLVFLACLVVGATA